jgi:CubicO group peptidase (beta-lactamase class C family)
MKHTLIVLHIFLLQGQLLPAQSIHQTDSLVKSLMDSANVTGICIGIIRDNKVVYTRAYGYRIKEQKLLNDTSTCFYAASLSKAVFAYLVMQLVENGIINLDTPIARYLPKPLPAYDNYKDLAGDDRWKQITPRICLSHTTGFPNWRQFNPNDNKKLEIFFTPGSRYAYSGEGINLLQMVIETITGRSLEDLAKEKVFIPLGMTRTGYIWHPEYESDYAVGYDEKGDSIRKRRRTNPGAAGSMETTISDYTRFMAAVMRNDYHMFDPVISIHSSHQFPSLRNDTTSANDKIHLSYGLGWGLFSTPVGTAFFKEGHDEGWVHYSIGLPSTSRALVIMCNSSNGEKIFTSLCKKLLGVTIPWQWEGYAPD